MGFFSRGYDRWEESYKNAVEKRHEAFMHICRLEDEGQSGTPNHQLWMKEYLTWSEIKENLGDSKPKYLKKYIANKFKS